MPAGVLTLRCKLSSYFARLSAAAPTGTLGSRCVPHLHGRLCTCDCICQPSQALLLLFVGSHYATAAEGSGQTWCKHAPHMQGLSPVSSVPKPPVATLMKACKASSRSAAACPISYARVEKPIPARRLCAAPGGGSVAGPRGMCCAGSRKSLCTQRPLSTCSLTRPTSTGTAVSCAASCMLPRGRQECPGRWPGRWLCPLAPLLG